MSFLTTGGLQCQRTMILNLKNDSNLNCRFEFFFFSNVFQVFSKLFSVHFNSLEFAEDSVKRLAQWRGCMQTIPAAMTIFTTSV